ncbi:MAG: hypothetical protein Q8O91_05605 [Candidatus Aminicenantes bacterium]|nr:hypothetical protein [Candidatus Aminicenantes bacterium]
MSVDKKISKVRFFRIIEGLTLDDISIATGLDRGLLSRGERGLYHLTDEQKMKIAAALRQRVEIIFPGGHEENVHDES